MTDCDGYAAGDDATKMMVSLGLPKYHHPVFVYVYVYVCTSCNGCVEKLVFMA